MGEATKPHDDVAVDSAPLLQFRLAFDQGHVAVLVLDPFRVLKRQQKEVLQFRRYGLVIAAAVALYAIANRPGA